MRLSISTYFAAIKSGRFGKAFVYGDSLAAVPMAATSSTTESDHSEAVDVVDRLDADSESQSLLRQIVMDERATLEYVVCTNKLLNG